MTGITIASMLIAAAVAVLLWLLRSQAHGARGTRLPSEQDIESALPRHYRFFPQVRQALSSGDVQYLRDTAPPEVARQAVRDRRAVARQFLSGLREDFSKLERLSRIVAALSPEVSREQETERLLLSLRFRVLYSLVCLRLATGQVPLQTIEHLTGLVGRLALRMERAITEINALSLERIPPGLSA